MLPRWMPASCSTCGSSCCLDSSSTCPTVGEVARNGFSPLALKIERVLERHPAVEDRLGIDQRRLHAGRADLEEHVRWRPRRRRGVARADVAEHGARDHLHAARSGCR